MLFPERAFTVADVRCSFVIPDLNAELSLRLATALPLLICILEAIGPISTTEGVPYTASPLVFIVPPPPLQLAYDGALRDTTTVGLVTLRQPTPLFQHAMTA